MTTDLGVAEEREEDLAVGVAAEGAGDLAGQELDLLDERLERGDEAEHDGAAGFASRASPARPCGRGAQPGEQFGGAAAAAVAVAGEEAGEPLRAEPAGVVGAGVALEEGERDRRVDVGEDPRGAGPEGVELRAQLVGERDPLLDQVLAGARQRLAAPSSRRRRARAGAAGACRCGRARRARSRRSRPTCRRRCGSGRARRRAGWGGPATTAMPASSSRSTTSPFGCSIATRPTSSSRRPPDERGESRPRCGRSAAARARRPSASTTTSRCSSLARSSPAVRSCIVSSFASGAGCGPTGEVPWRMLIDGPSAGRRPVAAPGASHRREAQVSSRAVYAASDEGALPAVVSHEPTLRTAPVDTRTDCVRADSQISKNKQNQRQG